VEAVAQAFASFRGRAILLWDDDIAGDIEDGKTLFRALAPHRGDTEAVFAHPLDFREEAGVQTAPFNILTPSPGTPVSARLEAEGRILPRDWSRVNGRAHAVFRPRHMSPGTLLDGFPRANQRFYSGRSIRKRLSRSPGQLAWTLPLTLAYASSLRRSFHAYRPDTP